MRRQVFMPELTTNDPIFDVISTNFLLVLATGGPISPAPMILYVFILILYNIRPDLRHHSCFYLNICCVREEKTYNEASISS